MNLRLNDPVKVRPGRNGPRQLVTKSTFQSRSDNLLEFLIEGIKVYLLFKSQTHLPLLVSSLPFTETLTCSSPHDSVSALTTLLPRTRVSKHLCPPCRVPRCAPRGPRSLVVRPSPPPPHEHPFSELTPKTFLYPFRRRRQILTDQTH